VTDAVVIRAKAGNGTGLVAYAICWSVGLSVGLSVRFIVETRLVRSGCRLVRWVCCMGPRMRQVDAGGDRPREGEFWGWTLSVPL